MDTQALLASLEEIRAIPDEAWLQGLDERKRRELAFHDQHRDRSQPAGDTYEKMYGNRKYYDATRDSIAYMESWIEREARDKVFLDYACGAGTKAIQAAKAGARLSIGLDISAVSVANATEDAKREGVADRCVFIQADAENTRLPADSIDAVICSGMLHHLDLSYAFPELRRILAPGGKILAFEALDYNPLIKLYRALTPAMRTEWEKAHILSLADVRFARRFFEVHDIRYWHITSIIGPHVRPLMPALQKLDALLTRIPLVKLMAWIFTFVLIKPPQPLRP